MTESRSWREEYAEAVHAHEVVPLARLLTDRAHDEGWLREDLLVLAQAVPPYCQGLHQEIRYLNERAEYRMFARDEGYSDEEALAVLDKAHQDSVHLGVDAFALARSRIWGDAALTQAFQQYRRDMQRDVARAFRVPRRLLGVNGPGRLCIDGHAYRRRQQARRRRSR